jgi:hypothetical protein
MYDGKRQSTPVKRLTRVYKDLTSFYLVHPKLRFNKQVMITMQRSKSEVVDLRENPVPFPKNGRSREELERHVSRLRNALQELYTLLEAYAPAWYTEREHEKVVSALRLLE